MNREFVDGIGEAVLVRRTQSENVSKPTIFNCNVYLFVRVELIVQIIFEQEIPPAGNRNRRTIRAVT